MPMHTADGKTTYKFDNVAGPVVLDRFGVVEKDVEKLKTDLQAAVEHAHSEVLIVDRKTDKQHLDHKELLRRHENLYDRVNAMESLMMPLLKSRLMRFLNFFGCWYIYGWDGRVYRNWVCNEKYGKAPLLTRASRWLMKHILN